MTDQGCDVNPITDWRFDVDAATRLRQDEGGLTPEGHEALDALLARLRLLEDVAGAAYWHLQTHDPKSRQDTKPLADALARLDAEGSR